MTSQNFEDWAHQQELDIIKQINEAGVQGNHNLQSRSGGFVELIADGQLENGTGYIIMDMLGKNLKDILQ